MHRRIFFVTGTDTNVGKTVASAALVSALGACYWKPIQSGLADNPGGDTATVAYLTGQNVIDFPQPIYSLQAPLSPDQAARRERISLEPKLLLDRIRLIAQTTNEARPLVIEGAGGLMVPLSDSFWMIDLMMALNQPIVLVARTTLGTLNHTLLSLEALRLRCIPLAGILFCGPDHPETVATIARHGRAPIIGRLPWLESLTPETIQAATHYLDLSFLTPQETSTHHVDDLPVPC